MTLRILVACEESQAVTKEFRSLGLEAYSCDIQPCSGGCPDWHIEGDAIQEAYSGKYIAMIAFPPCTHLAVSGAAWFEQKRKDGRQQEGIDFFMKIVNAPIKHIAVENPIGIMSKIYKKPTQVIQPYYFGDKAQKTTCLWLKNLPPLYHNAAPNLFDDVVTHTDKGEFFEWIDSKTGKKKRQPLWFKEARSLKGDERSKVRSKTFLGIAKAMAQQWSEYILNINL
jgi:hypothetical protein